MNLLIGLRPFRNCGAVSKPNFTGRLSKACGFFALTMLRVTVYGLSCNRAHSAVKNLFINTGFINERIGPKTGLITTFPSNHRAPNTNFESDI